MPFPCSESLLSSAELQEQEAQRLAILSNPVTTLTAQGFRTIMSALLLPRDGGDAWSSACEVRGPCSLGGGGRAQTSWAWPHELVQCVAPPKRQTRMLVHGCILIGDCTRCATWAAFSHALLQ